MPEETGGQRLQQQDRMGVHASMCKASCMQGFKARGHIQGHLTGQQRAWKQ